MQKTVALRQRLIIAVVLFSLIAASRVLILNTLEFHPDEVWQAWSALGTPQEVLAWVPFDWPPMFAYFSWAWTNLVGIHPYVLRLASVLIALLAYAMTFRVSLKLFKKEQAAWVTTAAYAALGYSFFLSVFFRGYILMVLLLNIALWFMLRYFEKHRVWDAIGLAVFMAALFYTNLTAVTAFGVIGVLSLALYPKQMWRWWLPGGIAAILAISEILHKLSLVQTRYKESRLVDVTALEAHVQLYRDFLGSQPVIWLGVLLVAVAIVLFYERKPKLLTLAILAIGFASAPMIYALEGTLGFFSARHSWWIMLGIALTVGAAFQYLPRGAMVIALIPAVIGMFLPLPLDNYTELDEPFEENFRILKQHLQQGDVLLIDPNCPCGSPMDWNYYERALFPDIGLHFVNKPSNHQRIWTVRFSGEQDRDLFAQIREGRLPSVFFGPPNFVFHLFEAPPNPEGILYDNGLRFHGVQILGEANSARPVSHEGEDVRVRLWWSVDQPLEADYSISLQLVDDNRILSQVDSAPQTITLDYTNPTAIPPAETSRWETGRLYVEERVLSVPNPTQAGIYRLDLIVYQWWDGVRIPSSVTNDDDIYEVMPFAVMSW